MSEQALLKKLLVEFSRLGGRLFRNNTAKAWAGQGIRQPDGSVLVKSARLLTAGLCEGSSDLIGWTQIKIGPEMLGREIAVFTAIEGKTKKTKVTKAQRAFIDAVNLNGGIGVIAYDWNDVLTGVGKYVGNTEKDLCKSEKSSKSNLSEDF